MSLVLINNAEVLVTMDDERREIKNGAIVIRDNVIEMLGGSKQVQRELSAQALQPQQTLDASGCILLPGLVNCHHHLYQTLTRGIATAEGKSLFDWLQTLYPIWGQMDAEAVYISAKLGLAELMLSGATTVADHLYLFPNGARLDDEIRAARELGVRFHPTRGSMSLGQSQGGLPPDDVCEDEAAIVADCERVIAEFHDPERYSMLRIGLAPCSPFSVTPELLRKTAELARRHQGVHLHTHLAETIDENRFCEQQFGMRPVAYMQSLGWTGEDVWFAHMVHPDNAEIAVLAETRSGVCHCPSSNMILASGIAPVRDLCDAGVRVGIGVDGSASNDGNQLLGEARQAMLLQRVGWPGFESSADRFSAREALELATRGGAAVLGRDDIGSLEVGKAADLVAYRVDGVQHAGSGADLVAGLLTCAPVSAWLVVINGRVVLERGQITGLDLESLVTQHNDQAERLLQKAGDTG
ncbi:MAG: 8-oxoguanine deaminase [Gammaproteobacteria bacterium]|nr:8-oxoguanine deaminase [Gammaproteobacteria bacterium]MBT8437057.1 8-oxoguanine deaminase [Gammaproteobacteria bacterium]